MLDRVLLMGRLSVGLLVLVAACKSSSAAPIDPVAEAYCADCCLRLREEGLVPCNEAEVGSCERLITQTLIAPCPDETSTYYSCVTNNACDESACQGEWAAREACIAGPDGGAGGGGGAAGSAGAAGGGGAAGGSGAGGTP